MTSKILPICSSSIELPLPERLTDKAIIEQAIILDENSFDTPLGKHQFREFQKDGFLIMSWPDGTRCAFLAEKALTMDQGIVMYRYARMTLEKFAKDLLAQKAYSC